MTSSTVERGAAARVGRAVVAALLLPALLVGQTATTPPALRTLVDKAAKAPTKDRVVNDMELGVAALASGEIDLARSAFDSALHLIEITHGGTEQARQARSLGYEEGTKDFKGEPYERAMAYYYRGLIYLHDRDADNARACFNAAILQDSFAEEQQNRCDFAVLYLLAAYAAHLQNDRAARDEAFADFVRFRPDFTPPDWDNSILAVVETGKAPRKLADGVGHFQMKILRGKGFKDVAAQLAAGEERWRAYPAEDIAFQAMTRGSRPIDAILEGKVQFKKQAENIGTSLTSVSSEVMVAAPLLGNTSGVQAAAGGLAVLGIASALIASNAKPRADTRYWPNLPDTVHVAFLPKRVRTGVVTAAFLDADGNVLNRQERKPQESDTLLWFKISECTHAHASLISPFSRRRPAAFAPPRARLRHRRPRACGGVLRGHRLPIHLV